MFLFSVVPIDELYIKANFKETQISKFKPDMKVEILVDSEKGEKMMEKFETFLQPLVLSLVFSLHQMLQVILPK